MNQETKKIIEIGGVKLEVDLRDAKVISNYRVGDNVKVLVSKYGDNLEAHPGVIVDFINFEKLPSIVVCYFDSSWNEETIKFTTVNKDSKTEIAPASKHEIALDKSFVLQKLNDKIYKAKAEIKEIETKKKFFLQHFKKYFKNIDIQ